MAIDGLQSEAAGGERLGMLPRDANRSQWQSTATGGTCGCWSVMPILMPCSSRRCARSRELSGAHGSS